MTSVLLGRPGPVSDLASLRLNRSHASSPNHRLRRRLRPHGSLNRLRFEKSLRVRGPCVFGQSPATCCVVRSRIGFGFSNNDATQLAMRRVWIASLIETTAAFSIGLGRQARMMRKGSIRVSGFLDCPRPVILAKPTNVGFSVRIIHSVTLAKDRVEKGSRV